MKYRIIQGPKRIVIDSALPVEIQVGETTKEVDAMAIVAAPNLAAAIAANTKEKDAIKAEYQLQLAEKDEECERLHNRLGMMAVIFKEMTVQSNFEKRGDRWHLMYAQRITNDQIELAYNMAQQVEVEQAFRRLLSKSEDEG